MQQNFSDTTASIRTSFQSFYQIIINFLPHLIAAILIFIIGWIIASLLGTAIKKVIKFLQIDELGNRLGLAKIGQQIGKSVAISAILGWLLKWFILIVSLVAAADALQLPQVSMFIYNQAIPYFGNVVLAAIILVLGILAANFLYELIRDALRASKFVAADMVASISRWAVLIFSLIAALAQLNIATFFMHYLFIAIISMFALAGGLAFGLGGRDEAKELLASLKKNGQG